MNLVTDQEMDLKEILLVFLKRWKLIIALVFIFGVFSLAISLIQRPVFVASSQIYVDNRIFPTEETIINQLVSFDLRQRLANKLKINDESIHYNDGLIPSILVKKEYKKPYILTVKAANKHDAIRIANTWADISMEWINQIIPQNLKTETNLAIADFEDADTALTTYLNQKGLGYLTFIDLQILTGIADTSNYQRIGGKAIPSLSTSARSEITHLMVMRNNALTNYNSIQSEEVNYNIAIASDTPTILNYSANDVTQEQPKTIRNIAIGITLGLIIGIFWVLMEKSYLV